MVAEKIAREDMRWNAEEARGAGRALQGRGVANRSLRRSTNSSVNTNIK